MRMILINYGFNRSSRRKRGMASKPLFVIPNFFCIFPMKFAMATLGLKEMGIFFWEGNEKTETTNRADLFSYFLGGIIPFSSTLR